MIKQIVIAGIAASALATATAFAVPIQIDSVNGSWTYTDPTAPTVSTSNANGQTNNKITWGNGSQQSGYQFDSVTPLPMPITEETEFDLGTFTHFNFPVTGTTLNSAELEVVTGLTIDGDAYSVTSIFDFNHLETDNNPTSWGWPLPCANGESNNQGINENGCADEVSFSFNLGSSTSVSIGNTDYFISILGFFANEELADTFWTKEKVANTATLRGIITSKVNHVPEPSTFALLGLGLMGLGLRYRKRNIA